MRMLFGVVRSLFGKARTALLLLSAVLAVTHLLTPRSGWADRGLLAVGTLLSDASNGCTWVRGSGNALAERWNPTPSAEADLLAGSIRSDERWLGCGSDGVKLRSAADKAPLHVTVYSGFTDVGFFDEKEGKFTDAWKLLGTDSEHVAKAVRWRLAAIKADETRQAVAAVASRLTDKPLPAGAQPLTDVYQSLLVEVGRARDRSQKQVQRE